MAYSVHISAKNPYREFTLSSDVLAKSKWASNRLDMLGWNASKGPMLPITIEVPAPHDSAALESFVRFIEGKDPMADTAFLQKHGVDAYILSHFLGFAEFSHHCEHMLNGAFQKGTLRPRTDQIGALLNTANLPSLLRSQLLQNIADQMIDNTFEQPKGHETLIDGLAWESICFMLAARIQKIKMKDVGTTPASSSQRQHTNTISNTNPIPGDSGSLFGSNASRQASSLFGQAASSSQNDTLGFGSTTGPRTYPGGLFDNPSSSQQLGGGLFGGNARPQTRPTGLFGSPQSSQQTGGGLFGGQLCGNSHTSQGNRSGLFGATQPATTSLFGNQQPAQQTTGGLFSGNNSSLFGDNHHYDRGSSLFDGLHARPASHNLFGSNQQPRSLFGDQNCLNNSNGTMNTGTCGLFGPANSTSSTGGTFGMHNTGTTAEGRSRSLFGNTNNHFGQPHHHDPAQHSCWATSKNTNSGSCGSLAGTSNPNAHSNVSPFGTTLANNTGRTFGDGSTTFEESSLPGHSHASSSYAYNIGHITTSEPKFFPSLEKESNGITSAYQHISFQERYKDMSPEEIRLIDYNIDQQANRARLRQEAEVFGKPAFSFGAPKPSIPMRKLNPDKALEQIADRVESQQQELQSFKDELTKKLKEEVKAVESGFLKALSDLGKQIANLQMGNEAMRAEQPTQEHRGSEATEAATCDDKDSTTSTPVNILTPASSTSASVADEADAPDGDDFVNVEA